MKENGEVDKYKACLVAKGYKQQYGVDCTEVFSPVGRHDTIRLVVAVVVFVVLAFFAGRYALRQKTRARRSSELNPFGKK